ncbi:hypothetical protein J5N97_027793 [Dioscorea zingiberensis]|uniref:Reticulon-like protein n=1 Tax=Dioscorea zingiberensis TaxID=325984 RepID=A0A9D5H4B2_9LILI|nr:hypothetical protein J5N97_027793 [Dioscorea zingiberensis]
MPAYSPSSDSDDEPYSTHSLFRRQNSLHSLLGGGKVADILLWRNKHLSGGILAGVTVLWFLFEVVEYHFLTLLCHISISAMLLVFIWSNGAALLDKAPPMIPEIILSERAFREVASAFHTKLSIFISFLCDIASGKDLKLFLMV